MSKVRWFSKRRSSSEERVASALAAWVTGDSETEDRTPWREVKPEKRSPWWWVFRGLVIIVAIAAVATLARTFLSSQATAPVVVETEAPLPDSDVRSLAERFVEAFYSWDSTNPEQRKQNLAATIAMSRTATTGLGWDGKGHQIASDARATTVVPTDDELTHVSVVFRLVTFDVGGNAQPTRWAQAVVSLTIENGGDHVAIAGLPGLVPLDEPVASTAEDPKRDDDIAGATRDYVKSFFTALGAQGDVNAEAAPGSHIRGLAGAVELVRVDSWKVWAGDGHTREAVAVVVWRNGSTEFTNEYAVTLTKITGGGESKWLVSAIHGAAN